MCLLGALLLATTACHKGTERHLADTENREFLAQCSIDGICAVTAAGEAKSLSAGSMSLRATGRIVGICGPLAAGTSPSASDCRPLVCESKEQCPSAQGMTEGVCIGGLCREPSGAINSDDAVMLCLAGTGTGPRTAQQIERLALGLNCGSPCVVPGPCRQP
jgi:hypothetical protein